MDLDGEVIRVRSRLEDRVRVTARWTLITTSVEVSSPLVRGSERVIRDQRTETREWIRVAVC